jgi:FK506-binding nuclear protein
MPLLPVALYGLEVSPGDVLVPAVPDFPATFRITMAAIDPSEPAEESANRPRSTLKIVRQPIGSEDDEDSEEYMRALLAESDSDEDSEDDEEEVNGGPSDPTKTKKARKAAALAQLMETLAEAGSDEEMEDAPNGVNGTKADKKGKAKATSDDEEDSEEDSEDDDEEVEVEEFVLCTLDPEKNYQQPLDITIAENERVFFKVTGTHTIYLTGNYVIPDDDGHNHHHEVYDSEDDEEDEDYDLSPDEDELELELDEDESDELDELEHPRVTEVDSDEEEAPKLVAKAEKKGKNKRSADEIDEATSLDDIMAKSLKPESNEEPKLSKKQLKKLKKNNGEAAPVKAETAKKEETKEAVKGEKTDKKVQFAKNLEQGPTGSAEKLKVEAASPAKETGKSTLGVKTVQGVKIDDKKLGSGPACKKGNKVSMRYIGKLTDGKVFDANKKGKAFSFKLGSGEVIKGWDIGVAGMCVGGERRLTIPSNLAYGSKSMPQIPANSTLVFDIKLLEIK